MAPEAAVGIGLQGPVQRGAVHGFGQGCQGFAQAGGCFAGGGEEQGAASRFSGQQLFHPGGFAGASPAGEHQAAMVQQPLLQGRQHLLVLLMLPSAPEFSAAFRSLHQHQRQGGESLSCGWR